MLQVSGRWRQSFPGASVGLLVLDQVSNPAFSEALEAQKRAVEQGLRERFVDRQSLVNDPVMRAYADYYKKFAKTYHVQQQRESVLFKGKSIPSVAGLVEAMFMAELNSGLLTAGHDWQALQQPLTLDATGPDEQYVLMNGKLQTVKAGDMRINDAAGIISSIIYGPDQRTCILPSTQNVAYVVYAPAGIAQDSVFQHLSEIRGYVNLFCSNAAVLLQQVHIA